VADPETWRDYVSYLAGERIGIPLEELENVACEKGIWEALPAATVTRPRIRLDENRFKCIVIAQHKYSENNLASNQSANVAVKYIIY